MMRVLVAESDRDVRGYLVLLLTAMGHGAAGVGSVEALSRRVARRAPDAVLCDASLPDGEGIEACRRLKLLRPALTIVIMAWDPSWTARARRAALGPVLLKPFSPTELRDALTFVLFSLLKTTLSRAVSDLKRQNGQIRAQIEDPKAAATGKGEK
ncbi:MAG: response regulator [Elusimicrobia bacterium]|nr:response regulator [Elusimicrobiota bacterium]